MKLKIMFFKKLLFMILVIFFNAVCGMNEKEQVLARKGNFYDFFNISQDASKKEIKQSFDHYLFLLESRKGERSKKFILKALTNLRIKFGVLFNQIKRKEYDQGIKDGIYKQHKSPERRKKKRKAKKKQQKRTAKKSERLDKKIDKAAKIFNFYQELGV